MGVHETIVMTMLYARQEPPRYVALNEREHRLLDQLAAGRTNVQIGLHLHRSEKTVRNQLTRLYRKLGAGNRAEAVALYLTKHREPTP